MKTRHLVGLIVCALTLVFTVPAIAANLGDSVSEVIVLGDADRDGMLTFRDAYLIMSYSQRAAGDLDCDFNGDGKADVADAVAILGYLAFGGNRAPTVTITCHLGDLNDDGRFNVRDVALLAAYLFGNDNLPCHTTSADFNRDGQVDFADWAKLMMR